VFAAKPIKRLQITIKNSGCSLRVKSRLSARFGTVNSLRQGGALACQLFKVALEKVTRGSGIEARGTTFYNSVQLLAYAGDLDLTSKTAVDLNEASLSLVQAAEYMGLEINEDKTKHIVNGKSTTSSPTISIGCYNFQEVETFVCLGTLMVVL
jgi:hypothetical protein